MSLDQASPAMKIYLDKLEEIHAEELRRARLWQKAAFLLGLNAGVCITGASLLFFVIYN